MGDGTNNNGEMKASKAAIIMDGRGGSLGLNKVEIFDKEELMLAR